jgi:DNA (cytosine-5)-methyltransferase 1
MTHASLFSGIGGFDLAAEWMGWENLFHCEWNPFGQKVLKHHFPNSISYNDITKTDFSIHKGSVDILTGGFPCQPYSAAGKRLGKADERHLFPHMLRCIKEVQRRWIIGENVRGLVNWNGGMVFNEVCDDLEREGYEVQPFLIPAAGVNAPHRRDRIWFIAYSNNYGTHTRFGKVQEKNGKVSKWNNDAKSGNTGNEFITNSNNKMRFWEASNNTKWENNQQESNNWNCLRNNIRSISQEQYVTKSIFEQNRWKKFPTKSPVCGGNDGLPRELDNITFPKWRNESIKAYGNAIVPQVAHQIFKTIQEFELMVNK